MEKNKVANDHQIMNEYMHSLIRTLQKEVQRQFLSNPNLYIYYKYNSDKLIIYIFVKVISNKSWYKDGDIYYLIKVGKDYPEKPPYVCCMTDFHDKIGIFDMRNIQKNLVGDWSQKYTINHIINELLIYGDTLAFQVENKLLPAVGEYVYHTYIYDLNDFLLNSENLFFRTYYLDPNNKSDISKNEKYMILTKTTILFFSNNKPEKKNLCQLEFKFELIWIDSLRRFSNTKYPEFNFFEIIWNSHSNYSDKFVFGTKNDMNINNKIHDLIIDRRRFLLNNFKYFEKYKDNSVDVMEKIINIKESFLNNYRFSISLFEQIHKTYRKIISLFNSFNDDGYQKYVQRLQIFISKYKSN